MIVFIFRADPQRSWSTTEPSLLSVLTCSNGKIAKQKRWKVSRRYIFAICTWAKKKEKKRKCLLLLLFLFSDRLWIDSVTLALIAWIFYAVARSYWICSDSCYSNIGYVGYDAPMLIWGVALWSLFIHLGQFLHKSRQTEQLHHSDFNSELLLIHLVKLRQKVFTISLGIPLPVSYHLAAIIPGSNCCWLDLKVPGENKEETQRATASVEAPEGLAQHSIA